MSVPCSSPGAAGNMDRPGGERLCGGFLYFKLIDFPIFNVADCYVVISIAAFDSPFLFVYSDEELEFLSFGRQKNKKSENGE